MRPLLLALSALLVITFLACAPPAEGQCVVGGSCQAYLMVPKYEARPVQLAPIVHVPRCGWRWGFFGRRLIPTVRWQPMVVLPQQPQPRAVPQAQE